MTVDPSVLPETARLVQLCPTTQRVACHDCDLLHEVAEIPDGTTAKCSRCAATLYRDPPNGLDTTLSLTVAAAVLFVLANVFPFMKFELDGRTQECSMLTGVVQLWHSGNHGISILVVLASVAVPLAKIIGLFYVVAPLHWNRTPWKLAVSYRWVDLIGPWGMLEVYLLGCLVAIIKLSQLATIELGIAFYSFVALLAVTTWAGASFDPRWVWSRLEATR